MKKEDAITLISFIERFDKEKPLYILDFTYPMMPYRYGPAINDFMDTWLKTEWGQQQYDKIIEAFNSNFGDKTWIAGLLEDDVLLSIQYIFRTDRFVDGHINFMIENGTLPALLERLRILNGL